MFVLVGLPVYRREWILPTWLQAIEDQDWPLDQLGFIFEVAPDDPQTTGILFDWHGRHPEVRCFEVAHHEVEHTQHPATTRKWGPERYAVLAHLRNCLLDRATCYQPDRYFSLDSDIILQDPTTISELVRLDFDAVSPLVYMTPDGTDFPNVMSWVDYPGGRAMRTSYPIGGLFPADVIMAAVMMKPSVYMYARYGEHRQGEDLAWAADCARLGINLWSASHIYASHVMYEWMLEPYLTTGDLRVPDPRRVEAAARVAVSE